MGAPYRSTSRPCPDCGIDLEDAVILGVERLSCASCTGVLVTTQQLAEMASALGLAPRALAVRGQPLGPGKLRCPCCATAMDGFLLSPATILAVCTEHGIWFARGVLGDYMERVIAPPPPPPEPARPDPAPTTADRILDFLARF
jgi:Zn-finger nucleic acid-binding protein